MSEAECKLSNKLTLAAQKEGLWDIFVEAGES